MMANRWMRTFAIACALLLLLASVAAEEMSGETLEEAALADGEQLIDQGMPPENIRLLLETAAQEVGYTEGSDGYSKYGAWTGDAYSEWCAEFVCWCVHMTDQLYGYEMLNNTYPYYTGQNTGRDWFISRGRFVYRRAYAPGWGAQWLKDGSDIMQANEYIPLPGDLVYFSQTATGDTVHVALTEYCTVTADGSVKIHVIEGNNPSSVTRTVYTLSDSKVLGFGCWSDVVDTTIQYGNTGDEVLKLQQNLGKLGYLAERHFTSTCLTNTRKAIVAFQQNMEGKLPTGIADRETQLAIQYEIDKLELHDPAAWLVTGGD